VVADFVVANVYDAVDALGGRRFDVVYTGQGALNWLPDLPRWAGMVHDLIEPGGVLYLSEFHPFQWVFGDDEKSGRRTWRMPEDRPRLPLMYSLRARAS
jgi:hypothetical protein